MTCDEPNKGHAPCKQCGQYHALVREQRLGAVISNAMNTCKQCGAYTTTTYCSYQCAHAGATGEPADSALDPFARIELLAAAWRNAYRALERGDATATDAHAREATRHFIALLQRLA